MVIIARSFVLRISATDHLMGLSFTTISMVYREWMEKRKYAVSGSSRREKMIVNPRSQKRIVRQTVQTEKDNSESINCSLQVGYAQHL